MRYVSGSAVHEMSQQSFFYVIRLSLHLNVCWENPVVLKIKGR